MRDMLQHMPPAERPKPTVETVRYDLLAEALRIATVFGRCPDCGEPNHYPQVPGENYYSECPDCGHELLVPSSGRGGL